jgi:uncharacterized membrane protein YkvI
MNRKAIQLAFTYMGVIIGGGFASGQEILQFFTGYGIASVAGTVLAGLLFAFLGWQIARLGTRLQAPSHKEVLHALFGHKAGLVMDILLTFFLFGVGVAMLAATGALFKQQFDLSPLTGSIFMAVVVVLTLCLNVTRIVDLVSLATPFLIGLVLIITTYALITSNAPVDELLVLSEAQQTVAPHWAIGALLYASFNIAVGFPMLAVLAGRTTDIKTTALGGAMGGIGLGVLIMLLNVSLFSNLNQLQGAELPTLMLASRLSPVLGLVMTASITCMIYSTAVGMFFAFSTRFSTPETNRFRLISLLSCGIGVALSVFGFTELVGTVYPLLGYLGLLLIAAIIFNWYRNRGRAVAAARGQ